MEQHFGVTIDYPLIADLDTKVAQLYGMIHPGASSTATVRCVFIIDDEGLLRAMVDHNVKRFILSSTANLFDAPERMPIDEKERIVPGRMRQ